MEKDLQRGGIEWTDVVSAHMGSEMGGGSSVKWLRR